MPGAHLEVAADRAKDASVAAGDGDIAGDPCARADLDAAARQASVALHGAAQVHLTAGCVKVLPDRSAYADVAARDHRVAANGGIDVDVAARDEQVAHDRRSDRDGRAGGEAIGAEGMLAPIQWGRKSKGRKKGQQRKKRKRFHPASCRDLDFRQRKSLASGSVLRTSSFSSQARRAWPTP